MSKKNQLTESIKWSFLEYDQYDRSRGWYLLAIIIGGFILVYSVLTANYLFALIIIMAGIILVIKHHNNPDEIKFEINRQGIKLGKNECKYNTLENFWIIYEPPEVKNLYFNFKSTIRPRLTIPIGDQNPVHIKALLREYLEEDLEQENEPVSEILGRLLKL
ncbi:MAG: hypothetical protein ABIJ91_01560 [Candidatus Kuenenbacteria bacterium]